MDEGGPEWTWRRFDRVVRAGGTPLLRRLPEFDNAILVGGCQRSGTTIVAEVIAATDGMASFSVGQFPELDAALILSAEVPHEPRGRYCFQTTYVDDGRTYLDGGERFRLVWCLRNPYSVVTSMLYNWAPFALIDTFRRCGVPRLNALRRALYGVLGVRTVRRLQRACHVYAAKVGQVPALKAALGDRMLVVDYDALVADTDPSLRRVYGFLDLPYRPEYGARIDAGSVAKASRLTPRQHRAVSDACRDVYERARRYA